MRTISVGDRHLFLQSIHCFLLFSIVPNQWRSYMHCCGCGCTQEKKMEYQWVGSNFHHGCSSCLRIYKTGAPPSSLLQLHRCAQHTAVRLTTWKCLLLGRQAYKKIPRHGWLRLQTKCAKAQPKKRWFMFFFSVPKAQASCPCQWHNNRLSFVKMASCIANHIIFFLIFRGILAFQMAL